uniref:RHS repeat-associated core domain-containing protein n=1 Tax=Streptomyces millisiae TaxID=3075542 RepID=UPI00374E0B94
MGHTTGQEWDRYDRALTVTDALGHTTRHVWDEAGDLGLIVRPDGGEIRAEYNELHLPTEVVRPDGSVWRQAYDAAGNRTVLLDPAGQRTHYVYDEHGAVVALTDALGRRTEFRRNAAGLPTAVVDPLGQVTSYEYDPMGRVTAVTDPLGGTVRMEWTREGHPARSVDALGNTRSWAWDGEGNCLAHTDENGNTTRFEYGPFDLPSAQTDPDGSRFELHRDTELRLVTVVNALDRSWDYTYDAAGRLVGESDFDGRVVHYTLDAVGQLVGRTNSLGQRVGYVRDPMGRIVAKTLDGAVTSYAHDPEGRLTHAAGPDSRLERRWDVLGRLVSETIDDRTVTRTFDPLGRVLTRTTPSGQSSRWSYDAAGRPESLSSGDRLLTFQHDAVGREITRHVSDCVTLSRSWDLAGRLTEQRTVGPDATAHHRTTYRYRPDAYLVGARRETRDETAGFSYALDPLGRITGVDGPAWSERYAYDAAGNQVTGTWPEEAPSDSLGERAYDGSRVARAGHTRYEYDAAGRVVLRQRARLSRRPDTWRYEWDAEDHLVAVTTPDGARWEYAYDPLGRRIEKEQRREDGTVCQRVVFSWLEESLVEQTTAETTMTWDYLGLHPVTQTESLTDHEVDRRFYAIVTDLVGGPVELVGEGGVTAWRARRTVWGVDVPGGGGERPATPLRFPGQYADDETGWHYSLFRHYDPRTARFTSPDPLGLGPAANHYTYPHNPHTWSDPLGLAPHGLDPSLMGEFNKQSKKYGKGGYRELENGRIRFYGRIAEARNPGEMVGRRMVREWDPATGAKRIWHETLDQQGNVRIVRPDVNVTGGEKVHYTFDVDGNFTGTF